MVAAPPKAHQQRSTFAQQLRQLGDVDRDAPRLVAREHLCGRAPARLILAVHVAQRLSKAAKSGASSSCMGKNLVTAGAAASADAGSTPVQHGT
jgi:hypothetical protein